MQRVQHRKKLLKFLTVSAFFTLLAITLMGYAHSSDDDATTPVFPSPKPWFDWGQRYIYGIALPGMPVPSPYTPHTYLMGFGNYEPDLMVGDTPYKVNITLGPDMSEASKSYLTSSGNALALDWLMGGMWNPSMPEPGLIFDGPLKTFEYPLYLGKTWSDSTTFQHPLYGALPVVSESIVVAYIPPDIESLDEIVVSPGYSYTLPDFTCDGVVDDDDALAVPRPLRELGDVGMDWDAMMDVPSPYLDWDDVKVPGGPFAGKAIGGYYVVHQTLNIAGSIMNIEAWKDVRGLVPVQIVNGTMTIACRWTGNFKWHQLEFGTFQKSFGIRIEDTGIGIGAGSFQFQTKNKDFGLKYAGDSMVTDPESRIIKLDYEDDAISCQAVIIPLLHNDLWLGFTRLTDLSNGKVYSVLSWAWRNSNKTYDKKIQKKINKRESIESRLFFYHTYFN